MKFRQIPKLYSSTRNVSGLSMCVCVCMSTLVIRVPTKRDFRPACETSTVFRPVVVLVLVVVVVQFLPACFTSIDHFRHPSFFSFYVYMLMTLIVIESNIAFTTKVRYSPSAVKEGHVASVQLINRVKLVTRETDSYNSLLTSSFFLLSCRVLNNQV